ncbi:LOW QUALITY PROTEIN: hypothetical protein HID58_048143 [Brassica napus]|uniref:Uncharacterized protein n=1 Tax=Brassica napus TaxID=3708 RepID=A0ABQ8B197_BRANA|nr:LOW QUALITY PROTEIN: hypothetical protein HID58_048143 [Brassica napus]
MQLWPLCLMMAPGIFPLYDNQLSLLSYLTTVTLQDQMDYYEWELDPSIYAVWTERKSRLHRNIYRDSDSLIRQIDLLIRNHISPIRCSNATLSSSLMQLWLSTA